MSSHQSELNCRLLTDFTDEESNRRWITVNDNVMGGRSEGGFQIEDGTLFFTGNINTDGGGFSSLRWPLKEGILKDAKAMKLRIKSDGRDYNLNLRTSARFRARQIAFRGQIESDKTDEWQEVTIKFDNLAPTIFGQVLSQAEVFSPDDARALGLIVADGSDGPFSLAVDWIKSCN